MKSIISLIVISLISSFVSAQTLQLDTQKATVSFYFHGDDVTGSVEGFEAAISFDPKAPQSAKFKGSVNVETLDTGIKMRDKHLKSKDFFEAETYPKMTFESKEIIVEENEIIISGNLTIKNTTRKETFKLTMSDKKIILTSRINTADYDVMKKKKIEKTNVDITIMIPLK
jgi:polyisoprenoid-binding protein YceI